MGVKIPVLFHLEARIPTPAVRLARAWPVRRVRAVRGCALRGATVDKGTIPQRAAEAQSQKTDCGVCGTLQCSATTVCILCAHGECVHLGSGCPAVALYNCCIVQL